MEKAMIEEIFEPAPPGMRVRFVTLITLLVALVVLTGSTIGAVFERDMFGDRQAVTGIAVSLIAPIVIGAIWLGAHIRGYRVADGALVVLRLWHKPRFPLAELASIECDRNAMAKARKVSGNDGLGAIAGRFRNRELGTFTAYVSNKDNAVVLRWPDRVLVVSPERDYEFAKVVRAHAGLKD